MGRDLGDELARARIVLLGLAGNTAAIWRNDTTGQARHALTGGV
jgi:hypothetical protein